MQSFGRRRFLRGAAIFGAAGAAGSLPVFAAAEERVARAEHVTFRVPGLDPAHDGLRVAQLSDIHVGPRTSPEVIRGAIEEANAFAPDLVVLTGDYVSRRRSEIAGMREQLGGLAAPTVAVLGNHDVWVDPRGAAAALRGHGYEVLENAWTRVTLRGAPLTVVGIGDQLTGRADVAAAVRGLGKGAPPLVLAHGPRTANRLAALDRPLVCLSGHTHGGQINLPILTPLLLATLREPYVRGRYAIGHVQLYVNRGVGMSGIGVRLNAPAEVTLATLRRAEPGRVA
ncbi:MAG TPA: metallophosphoesterase [Anaeromyxobacter sp.]